MVPQVYTQHPARKIVVCTNSNTNTEITLTSLAESVLKNHTIAGDVIALAGECGHCILYPSSPVMALSSGMSLLLCHCQNVVMRQVAKKTLISELFIDEVNTIHRESLSGSQFKVDFDYEFTHIY